MAIITYPLNNTEYSAEDAELYHSTRTSGIFAADQDFNASVSETDNTVTISAGIAWIRNSRFSGKVVANKGMVALDMGVADGAYNRIDAIVLRFDANANATSLVNKQGAASSDPSAPDVTRTEAVYELHLYHVRRRAGATAILLSDITDLRANSEYCGLMTDASTSVPTKISQLENDVILETWQGGTGAVHPDDARRNLRAAPDGYGLGGIAAHVPSDDNLEDYPMTGFFKWNGSAFDQPFEGGVMIVVQKELGVASRQIAVSDSNIIAVRSQTNGEWGPWEYVNPPMEVGIEYRTTERFLGKVVYTAIIDGLNEPAYEANSYTSSSVAMPDGIVPKRVIRHQAWFYLNNDITNVWQLLPYNAPDGYIHVGFSMTQNGNVTAANLDAYNNPLDVGYRGAIQIWYTKE